METWMDGWLEMMRNNKNDETQKKNNVLSKGFCQSSTEFGASSQRKGKRELAVQYLLHWFSRFLGCSSAVVCFQSVSCFGAKGGRRIGREWMLKHSYNHPSILLESPFPRVSIVDGFRMAAFPYRYCIKHIFKLMMMIVVIVVLLVHCSQFNLKLFGTAHYTCPIHWILLGEGRRKTI